MPCRVHDVGILRDIRHHIDRRTESADRSAICRTPKLNLQPISESMKSETERVTTLEIQLAHLQRQYDVLNDVVTEIAMQLDKANKRIFKWEQTVDRLKNSSESAADPLDEKPPHY